MAFNVSFDALTFSPPRISFPEPVNRPLGVENSPSTEAKRLAAADRVIASPAT